jgi:hypothetical protein
MKEILKKIYEGKIQTKSYNGEWLKHAGVHTTAALIYGEVIEIGISKIIRQLRDKKLFKDIHFLDLGSGNGRSVLHMGLMDEVISSTGIEVFESKSDYANNLFESLDYPHPEKINLINKDWDSIDDYSKYNLVLLNNIDTIYHPPFSVLKRLKKGTILLCVFGIKNSHIIGVEKLEPILCNYSWTKKELKMIVYKIV